MRRVKVLSVDWDYFLPDPSWYDWTHNEESALFYEMVWSTRPGTMNLRTGEKAFRSFVPDRALLDGFWGRVLAKGNFPVIHVMESHKSLGEALLPLDGACEVWNFDQHHDLGYDDRPGLDCGNWGRRLLEANKRTRFYQVYPPWRAEKGNEEKSPSYAPAQRVSFACSHDGPPLDPDVVFVCRSSCWTPPWADDEWLAFLKPLEKIGHGLPWKHRVTVDFVTRVREPGKGQAELMAKQWDEVVASMTR